MKYFTKDYYALIDASVLGIDLVAAPSAKRKSENYFQHLYAERQAAWLNAKKEDAAAKGAAFDEAAEIEAFKTDYQVKLRDLSTILPPDILQQVADIRVMALGSCSTKVKQLVTKFCKHQDLLVEQIRSAYWNYWENASRGFHRRVLENYGFEYCTVTAIGRDGDNVVMTLDNSDCYDDVKTVIWKNAELLELEDGVVGARWVENELYKRENGLEFHAILEAEDGEMVYLTVAAEDVEFVIDEEKRKQNEEAAAKMAESEDFTE